MSALKRFLENHTAYLSCFVFLFYFSCSVQDSSAPQQDNSPFDENECVDSCGGTASAYGIMTGTYRGVPAYSNGATHDCHYCADGAALGLSCGNRCGENFCSPKTASCSAETQYGLAYQCVEYIRRFYATIYKDTKVSTSTGNAKDYATKLPSLGFTCYKNSVDKFPPQPDDILVWTSGVYGHVGIVRSVNNKSIRVIQQNNHNNDQDASCIISMDSTSGNYTLASPACGLSHAPAVWCRNPNKDWKTCSADVLCPDGYSCFAGVCMQETTCTNGCTTQGQTRCVDANTQQTCADLNGDGCLEWGGNQSCACAGVSCSTPPTWRSVASGTGSQLMATWGSTSNDVWATGFNGTFVRWNGTGWNLVASGSFSNFRGIWGSSKSDVWAVGSGPTLLRWSGANWAPVAPGPNPLYGVSGTTANDVWAVGGSGDTILHWSGSNWVTSDLGANNIILSGVWAASNSEAWTVGYDSMTLAAAMMKWNGTSWVMTSAGTSNALRAIWGRASNDVWSVGENGTAIHWNGSSWSTTNTGTNFSLYGVWGSNSNDVWAVGGLATGIILHWNGSSWSSVSSPTTQPLYSIWGITASDIWAVGANGATIHYSP